MSCCPGQLGFRVQGSGLCRGYTGSYRDYTKVILRLYRSNIGV